MLKTILFLVAGLVAGLLAATWWQGGGEPPVAGFNNGSPAVLARIDALEASLNREALRRAGLESELADVRRELDALQADTPAVVAALDRSREPRNDANAALEAEGVPEPPLFARRRMARGGSDELRERLIDAGFSADRAQWLEERTAELRMQALQAQYDAAREGVPLNLRAMRAGDDTLRSELSNAEYERYLQAMGRPTSVRVGAVLASSPAEQVGLLAGDEVVSYAGQRIYDMGELNALILEGQPGAPVTVDVLRDGQPMQVVMPRGPLGIAGRGFGRR
jgi:hypothetical protein